jgi:hypothetical protein
MNASVPQPRNVPGYPRERDFLSETKAHGRAVRPMPADSSHEWLVDISALVRCREILSGHHAADPIPADRPLADGQRPSQLALMDIPPAYDQFCRAHFGAVRRTHPELTWEDVCPAYAIALSAHAVLCVSLDHAYERALETNWPELRGGSALSWPQARTIIADGCSALNRLDPLAMDR